jgi:hypothetical protein
MDAAYRRRLHWHGFLLMFVALLLGFPTTLATNGRPWMAAHVTGLIGALVVMGVAGAWDDLRLTDPQKRRAFVALLLGAYANLTVNVCGALVNYPGPATKPGVTAPRWQNVVFGIFAAVLVPALLTAVWTVLHGLRREVTASSGTR